MATRRVFLLSPAFAGGRRSQILMRPGSELPIAKRLQSGELTLGEAFSFLSGLYFRGKLAYGHAFGGQDGTLVITPSRGLMNPAFRVTGELLQEFAATEVSIENPIYREPLERDAARLRSELGATVDVVLLGSVATGKYVDVLSHWFEDRLLFPSDFIGRGDMSRGGLLLRRVDSGEELAYQSLQRGVRPKGARPTRLPPRVWPIL